jgi:anti-anti-sigma factor
MVTGPHDRQRRQGTHGNDPGGQLMTDRGDGIQIVHPPGELDLATAGSLAAQGCAAIARHARLLLLDLTGLSFCDARGLSALVTIANHADKTGCRYGLIAPQPPVAKLLRITGLDQRMPVFATTGDALARLAAMASASAQ